MIELAQPLMTQKTSDKIRSATQAQLNGVPAAHNVKFYSN
jgi:hypothetical protein